MLTHCSRANHELLLEITDGGLAVTLQIGENLTDRGVAGKGGLWHDDTSFANLIRYDTKKNPYWSIISIKTVLIIDKQFLGLHRLMMHE